MYLIKFMMCIYIYIYIYISYHVIYSNLSFMIQIWIHQDLGIQGMCPAAAAVFWALSSLCAESSVPLNSAIWRSGCGMLLSFFVQRIWAVLIMIHYTDISWLACGWETPGSSLARSPLNREYEYP